MGNTI